MITATAQRLLWCPPLQAHTCLCAPYESQAAILYDDLQDTDLSKPFQGDSRPNLAWTPQSQVYLFRMSTASDSSAREAADLQSVEPTLAATWGEWHSAIAGAATALSTSSLSAGHLQQERALPAAKQAAH